MSNSSYNGERFLDKLYQDLYNSPEVNNTKRTQDSRKESIRKYMNRLVRIHSMANTKHKKHLLKQLYYRKYIIKEDNIPDHLNKQQVIKVQKKSLDKWIDYLTDENAKYPMWAKYWAFQGMLRMGTYDDIKGVYQRRSKNTINPFVEANPEIIAKCISTIVRELGNEKIDEKAINRIIENQSFSKLYAIYEQQHKNNVRSNSSSFGVWKKFNRGNKEEAIQLAKSLEGHNTGWCTADELMAINQVRDGDFYVYYTMDEKGKFTIPRIAIRMEGTDFIGEIRGIEEAQNLEEHMIPVLESKLKSMSFLDENEVNRNLLKISDLKELYKMRKKEETGESLTSEELRNLYTKKYGFGWDDDPNALKLISKRNDYEFIIQLINEGYDMFDDWDDELNLTILLRNPKIALAVYKKKGYSTGYDFFADYPDVSDELADNSGFMLELIKLDSYNFVAASDRLQNDRTFVLSAIKCSPDGDIECADKFLLDKEILREIKRRNPETYETYIEYDDIAEIVAQNEEYFNEPEEEQKISNNSHKR